MAEDIIERAAKAAMGDAWIMLGQGHKEICRKQVRLVLLAMREPTPAMIDACIAARLQSLVDGDNPRDRAVKGYAAMIDAACRED